MSRAARAIGVAIGLCTSLATAGPALAGTVGLAPVGTNRYQFTGSPGETNSVTLTFVAPDRVRISDTLPIAGTPPLPCVRLGATVVECPPGPGGGIVVEAGDGNDTVVVTDDLRTFVHLKGGDGNDGMTSSGGREWIWGGSGGDTINAGAGDDIVEPGPDLDSADGGPGVDLLGYDNDSRAQPVVVDLRFKLMAPDGDSVPNFENVMGTRHNDDLTGNGGNNVLFGLEGTDILQDGDGGFDTVDYRDRETGGITVNLVTGITSEDQLVGQFESAIGTAFDDALSAPGASFAVVLDGWLGGDHLQGGNADDVLIGGDGADALQGGAGTDIASYRDRTAGVNVSLRTPSVDGDSFVAIEGLEGGSGNDVLEGDDLVNTLIGNGGADVLDGGLGADLLYGNGTSGASDGAADTATYRLRSGPVISSLAGEHQDGDFYSDIQNLTGSSGNDMLTGDAGANVLDGGSGNDFLTGGAGMDLLQAGDGNDDIGARDGEVDTVNCGAGFDLPDADATDVLSACESPPPAIKPRRRCVVPDVRKRTVAGARRLLNAKRCRLGKIRRAYSRRVRKGRIISQARRPGLRLPQRAKVAVVVSLGRRR